MRFNSIFYFEIFSLFFHSISQIINLKRFQYLNGRWVKSHKIVNFPLQAFDPSAYLAERDPRSPLETKLNSTDSTFAPSSTSDPAVHHHPRLQQVEHYHQQGEGQPFNPNLVLHWVVLLYKNSSPSPFNTLRDT